jgi:multidrug efflux pump subunit AcrB
LPPGRRLQIDGAFVITILPPPINGIGNAGGFKMMLEDKKNLGPAALEAAAQELAAAANADPRLSGVFTPFTSTTPNLYADIDRVRAAKLGVPAQRGMSIDILAQIGFIVLVALHRGFDGLIGAGA